ncbi:hypothetical protein ACQ4PT_035996 [Festuca glaucescens]
MRKMISLHPLGLDTVKESVYAVLEQCFLSPSLPHLFSQAGEDAPRTETARFRDEEDHARLIDVVGLVNKVTYVLPPSGNARSQKRQVYITDGSEHAIVTLCGEHADLFDADGLMEASDEEPIIVLFVGMTISLLAFKNTSVTRWHVNVPILEIADVRERSKHLLWCIELHSANQSRSEPTVSLIEEMAAFEPNDIMGEFYKISNRITDVLITKGWYYISCKEYWKMVTLEDGVYKCPWCPTVIPLPRYRLIVGAVDAGSTDPLDAKFTDLYLFGPPEETVVRKEALLLVSSVRGLTNAVPKDLLENSVLFYS